MSRTVHYIHFNPVHFNPVQLSVLAVVNRSPGTGCLVGLLRRLGTPFLQIRFARCDKPCLGLLPQSRNRGLRMSLFGASRPHRLLSSAAGLVKRPKWNPSESLRFPLRDVDPSTITPSGWVPPQGGYENLPFRIFRTEKGKQLPVYTDYRNGRSRCMTILRRYRGNVNELAEDMSRVCDDKPVSIRPGRIEVKGNYRGRVTEWLERLGF